MAGKNLSTVASRATIPSTGGVVTINTGTNGETEYIEKDNLASEISNELGLGDIVTKNVGYHSGRVMVNGTNIYEGSILTCGNGMVQPLLPNDAFNKDFAGSGSLSTVARSDHGHNALLSNIMYSYTEIFNTDMETTKSIMAPILLSVASIDATYINPAVIVSLYKLNGVNTDSVDIINDQVTVVRSVSAVIGGNYHALTSLTIKSLTTSTNYMICVSFSTGRILVPDETPT